MAHSRRPICTAEQSGSDSEAPLMSAARAVFPFTEGTPLERALGSG